MIKKHGFKIFVFLSIAIIVLGLLFLLFDKKTYFPGVVFGISENQFWDGRGMIVMGSVMLLFGLLLKWVIKRDKSDNGNDINLPRRRSLLMISVEYQAADDG